jgi:hypothetical protein
VAKSPEKSGERFAPRTEAIPQILRQRRIMIGEFLVSLVLTHISAFWLSH